MFSRRTVGFSTSGFAVSFSTSGFRGTSSRYKVYRMYDSARPRATSNKTFKRCADIIFGAVYIVCNLYELQNIASSGSA
eukprot:SAG11_NODE_9194_length_934_cov_0.992814_2_plen_79_part_00